MKNIIAIDPGSSSGAIAYKMFGTIKVANLEGSPEELLKQMAQFPKTIQVYVENVGGTMPGNSARSARTFATHMGHLEMAMAAAGLSVNKVAPQTWMKEMARSPEWPRNPRRNEFADWEDDEYEKAKGLAKKARKQYIYNMMKRRYPDTKFTKRQADAVGILDYVLREKTNVL
jgi:hypothetical protein